MPGKLSAFWQERLVQVEQLRANGLTAAQIAAQIGSTEAAVNCQLQRTKRARLAGVNPPPYHPEPPPPPPDPAAAEQARLERRRGLLQEHEAIKAVAGEKSLRNFLETLVRETALQFPKPPAYHPPPAVKGAAHETVVQQLSDFHAYEVVSAERTRGFNEYNALEMGKRSRGLVERHLSIKERMERGGGWRFDKLVLGLNGDFVSGTIHEVERHSDAPNIVLAVYGMGLVLGQMIRDLAARYPLVELFCSSGNHGRLPDAHRMQQKDPLRSWDTLIYLFAKEHTRDLRNLRWYLPDSYSVAFDVEGWRFLQTHGHDIKSWNSLPWYGMNRMIGNLNALEAGRGTPIHYFLFGHFHNIASLAHATGESFTNGSLIGGTEFSVQGMGRSDSPRQWMLGVHKEEGVSHRWSLTGKPLTGASYDVAPWEQGVA